MITSASNASIGAGNSEQLPKKVGFYSPKSVADHVTDRPKRKALTHKKDTQQTSDVSKAARVYINTPAGQAFGKEISKLNTKTRHAVLQKAKFLHQELQTVHQSLKKQASQLYKYTPSQMQQNRILAATTSMSNPYAHRAKADLQKTTDILSTKIHYLKHDIAVTQGKILMLTQSINASKTASLYS